MKRLSVFFVALTATAFLIFTASGASADFGDSCWDGSSPTEVATPGPVGVGYEAGDDGNATYQHLCYRVYDPVSGHKLLSGLIKPYQYHGSSPPPPSGGVQCLPDTTSHPLSPPSLIPYCYVIYAAYTNASPSGAGVGGWLGNDVPGGTVLVPGVGVDLTALVAPIVPGTQAGAIVLTPNACAGVNGVGTCTGRVAAGAAVAPGDPAVRAPFLGIPTGVDPDTTPDPLVAVTVGSTTESIDIPATCIGIC